MAGSNKEKLRWDPLSRRGLLTAMIVENYLKTDISLEKRKESPAVEATKNAGSEDGAGETEGNTALSEGERRTLLLNLFRDTPDDVPEGGSKDDLPSHDDIPDWAQH